ncbi:MAG TPA: GntR family transcriptional regulator [Gemmatimonadales bacterium]|nr:GntR family transcriptional regulator [Gemmatimonadales bacterium]
MFDHIDPRSPTPLYAQIAGRLKVAVAAGELRPGESLPSVRQLAARLRLNPATIAQAYRELESEGFVEMRQGSGTFIKDVATERRAQERGDQAVRLVRAMLAEAAKLGIQKDDLRRAMDRELGAKTA